MTEVEKSILVLLEIGMTITNQRSGYIEKGEYCYLHQNWYKSTSTFVNAEDAIKSFLAEVRTK